ncbi:hypothetical protein CRM22_003370 [Opisthorchis felineus]|uniref:Protein quiver n=1 Tax=Opisthorchis felineus TaxID=147828 RepID=A0A4S2M1J8_OPIFE|nr:hypothetical protein CRM22_003370 [Opisthorchis felineus]
MQGGWRKDVIFAPLLFIFCGSILESTRVPFSPAKLFRPFLISATSLECVVCDSYTSGKLCSEWDQFSLIKDCSQEPHINSSKPMSCRKIDQTVDNEDSVIRQCSNVVNQDGCIDRIGVKGVRMRYCHCKTDLCNGAVLPKTGPLMHVFGSSMTLLTVLYLVRA